MNFSEKLNYLFDLTHAEGKELAAEMNVTAPQISKMRNGVRGLPNNKETAWMIANFFAKRCNNEYQRNEIAHKIRLAQAKNLANENELTDVFLEWFTDEYSSDDYAAKRADDFLKKFGKTDNDDREETENGNRKSMSSDSGRFFTFFGYEGRRKALLAFFQYILQRKVAHVINILSDEKMDWIMDDPNYSGQLQDYMQMLVEQGCTFKRVVGPITDINQAFESLNRWFPFYIMGKANSYYYNRLRDGLNKITICVVPNVAVLFSMSVGSIPQQNGVTFFTTDVETVNSMATEFDNYFKKCEPMMRTYGREETPKVLFNCMVEYEGYGGNCIHRSNGLPFLTLPWEIATSMHTDKGPKAKDELLLSFASRYKMFRKNLDVYQYTDILRLADYNSIMSGKVLLPISNILSERPQFYSPNGYLQHLNSILFLLEQRENYHVVLHQNEWRDTSIIYVKDGFSSILIRERDPFSIFVVSEKYLNGAFTESLKRLIPADKPESEYRKEVIDTIRELVTRLEVEIKH